MRNRKHIRLHIISLGMLLTGFLLCRYGFFEVHGMKEWPVCLFIVGLIVIGVSFMVKAEQVPVITSLAYTVGFVAGAIFQTERVDMGGGRTNDLWIIWTVVFVCFVVSSVINEGIAALKKRQKSHDDRERPNLE